jgi:GntR family transcriptional regulator, vanillate catabolism transcriptional regulator
MKMRFIGFYVYIVAFTPVSLVFWICMPNPANPPPSSPGAEEGSSQAVKAQQRLRELILAGALSAGTRITELAMVDRLGMSRTPIRAALMRLGQEGLLLALPHGGYAVRTFSEREVADAIELRGTLEGLAARLAAERGAAPALLSQADHCLEQIDRILRQEGLDDEAFSGYVRLNAQFHQLLSDMAGSSVLAREIERACSWPFASPSGFVGVQAHKPGVRDTLVVAQHQHRQVLQAIAQREAGRAEALVREHSRIARQHLSLALQHPQHAATPGVQLIRQKG